MNHYLKRSPNSRLVTAEEEFLYFGGTSYLGLQSDSEFQDLLIQNIRILGTNWGASRKSNIRLCVFEEFEDYLAQKAGAESCLCVSSGYMAGQMLKRHFSEQDYQMFCAPHTHPAIIHEKSRLFQNYEDLSSSLVDHLNSTNEQKVVLFLDTIDFSGINFPHFESLQKLPLENVILVADDSHGFGLIGEDGYGSYSMLRELNAKELIVCGSLGKALATPSGAILGRKSRIEQLNEMEFFAGGSPPSPAALKTLMEAEALIKVKKARLLHNIEIFIENCTQDFELVKIAGHPVFGYDNEKLTDYLLDRKIITTNFRYPAPSSPLVSKIVLNAQHSTDDILELTAAINSYFKSI
ncbi:aminotransferase class I/II-fold pyridoxal phosphate-dependent enzyme [Gramella sp. GC03-9]|uniref:Aminotransferase class I/II-fold pyridoxal phosphate-dependent enzyme n=1 Tax=Christiangramia oceanisediminis TaxID=2920386 RepID=A0A9X2KZK9_9FLAO|nr:aminotransferase class I/II-fold pyridoxal phosphate-dependent enzyme [Gramella oceanisediminis]MCP9201162.1 aminotransferase class I/II-fold pyridoxal phosphate-dependent enzyme [Gramella oceanisediminis]